MQESWRHDGSGRTIKDTKACDVFFLAFKAQPGSSQGAPRAQYKGKQSLCRHGFFFIVVRIRTRQQSKMKISIKNNNISSPPLLVEGS